MRVLATYNIKGGVGKTATAVNLAYLSARDGQRTLLWDLDPQGAASYLCRVEPRIDGGGKALVRGDLELNELIRGTDFEGLDLLPADFSYRHMDLALDGAKKPTRRLARLLQPLAGAYDHLFLDCAPSISLVSEAVFVAADALLVPTIPTALSLRTLERLRSHLAERRRSRVAVLAFFCMVDRRKSLHSRIAEQAGDPAAGVLRATIPYSALVEQMSVARAPLFAFARSSAAAQAYEALWREILSRLPPSGP